MMVMLRRAAISSLIAAFLPVGNSAQALTILSGASFTKSTNAPLAGTLQLSTDQDTRVSVTVDDGTNLWNRNFYDYTTNHSVPLYGFKPARTNWISVTVHDRHRNQASAGQPLAFVTDPLPTNFPNITVLASKPDQMEPGYTLFRTGMKNDAFWYVMILDSAGEVVWYNIAPTTVDVRRLDNGDLFMPWTTNFFEINLLGQIVHSWVVPPTLPINLHDGVPTDHGTILYLSNSSEVVTNYPSSMTVSNAPKITATVRFEKTVEISQTNSSLLNVWTPINFLDPRRISYLIVNSGGWDSEHCNAIIEDPRDNTLIVSMRHQNAVIKFRRDTGQIKWILGPHDGWGPQWQPYLLTPVGTPFFWQYGQHAPIITASGTLIMHDNGNFRAMPFAPSMAASNSYTRAVEYSINEQTMEVSQVWEYGQTNSQDVIFNDHEGNAEPEPITGNVLVDFAALSYLNGNTPSAFGATAYMTRITEVTHDADPQVVFDLAISIFSNTNLTYHDTETYRAHRIPDLYAHPAVPVTDLSVSCESGVPSLNFSADDYHTYSVEASTNLVNWDTIGTASEDDQDGDYSFEDTDGPSYPVRYYRVVTQ